jgi:hypothetical protein
MSGKETGFHELDHPMVYGEAMAITGKARRFLLDNRDCVFYRWYSVIYSPADLFARLDKTFLYLMGTFGEEPEPEIYRILPYTTFIVDRGREVQIVYTTDPVFRVLEGTGKGSFIPESLADRYAGRIHPVGIHKKLQVGNSPWQLRLKSDSDRFVLSLLDQFNLDNCVLPPGDEMAIPSTYLCWYSESPERPRHLKVRSLGNASMPEYDKVITDLKVEAGAGRVAVPFDKVYGRGVIVTGFENNSVWRAVRKDGGGPELPHFTVRF